MKTIDRFQRLFEVRKFINREHCSISPAPMFKSTVGLRLGYCFKKRCVIASHTLSTYLLSSQHV